MTPGLNLESCPNQLSKFGELSKSALQIWLPSDSQKIPHRHPMDSGHRHTSNPKTVSKNFFWMMTPSPNLESCPDELSKCGYYQTPNRPPDNRHPMDPDGPCRTYDGSPRQSSDGPLRTHDGTQIKLSYQILFLIYKKRGLVVISYIPA